MKRLTKPQQEAIAIDVYQRGINQHEVMRKYKVTSLQIRVACKNFIYLKLHEENRRIALANIIIDENTPSEVCSYKDLWKPVDDEVRTVNVMCRW